MGGIKTFFAMGCTHIPHHDKENTAYLIEQIKERQPQVIIHLGDLMDFGAVSSYPNGDANPLEDEYDQGNEFIDLVNQAAPNAVKIFMEGNHCERVTRPDFQKLAGLIHYRRHMKALKRWKHYEYVYDRDNVFKLGQLTFAHGWAYTLSGTRECKEGYDLANGNNYGAYIHAHTHRPVDVRVSWGTWQVNMWRYNVGCGIDFHWAKTESYAKKRNLSRWRHAFVAGWANTKRREDSRKNWKAETIYGKGAWD